MFIYPDNLKAKATLWLWQLRDVAISNTMNGGRRLKHCSLSTIPKKDA